MARDLGAGGFLARIVFAMALVFGTYNPTDFSYISWAFSEGHEFGPVTAVVGLLLLIGWIVFLRATFLSMGIEHNYIPACKERLTTSSFPVSIVHGSKDMIPVSTTRKYIQLFPKDNVQFYVIEDGDHSLFDHKESIKIVNETMKRA